jgi:cellulose synthase/poly-beta-1,6-N-acetylglucosamine synthase-like glycosyltransferase
VDVVEEIGVSIALLVFWGSVAGIAYAYFGYPILIRALASLRRTPRPAAGGYRPSITMIVPVHNERAVIEDKIANTRALRYPEHLLEVLFVSDGSTDGTAEIIARARDARIQLIVLSERGGKAGGLNAGLARARHEIVVFSDAAIMLDADALEAIVQPFADAQVGCVSGEDRIAGAGGEGLYGRYELFLRRQESEVYSIVGASGSFYAQRRALCEPFIANVAPDFLSVLRTVERGYRAITEPRAAGTMTALASPADEFRRKVRTILRGLTTLATHARLLNPLRYGVFAFELVSHKLMRWLVPFFLLAMFGANAVLAVASPFYAVVLAAQVVFYGLALAAFVGLEALGRLMPVRVSVYFTTVNLATLSAWGKFALGARQELWSPSRR